MKAIELKEEVKVFILNEVQMSVMRLWISAPLVLAVEKDYRGEDYLAIESAKFQTTPVLFKELWLTGWFSVEDREEDDYLIVCVNMDYNWRSFSGGTNGTDLGRMRFIVEKDLPKKLTSENVHIYVSKSHGFDI